MSPLPNRHRTLRRRGLRASAATTAAALLVAACGSSDSSRYVATQEDSSATTTAATAAPTSPTTAVPAPATTIGPPPAGAAAAGDGARETLAIDSRATDSPVSSAAAENVDTNVPDAAPRPGCRRLTDFDESDRNSDWFVVNDGVMGGRSDGRVDFDGSTMVFDGTVVTAGGGFTSVRLRLFGDELVGSERLDVRLRADDRTYGITLEDTGRTGRRAVAHRADFDIPAGDADGWSVASLDYTELQPSVFGQPIDVAAFDPGQAVEIGLIIADGIDGGFAVTVDWIDACA